MRLLQTPYAFYEDGKLNTIYNLYEIKNSEEAKTFVMQAEHADTWNAIQEYVSSDAGQEYSSSED